MQTDFKLSGEFTDYVRKTAKHNPGNRNCYIYLPEDWENSNVICLKMKPNPKEKETQLRLT